MSHGPIFACQLDTDLTIDNKASVTTIQHIQHTTHVQHNNDKLQYYKHRNNEDHTKPISCNET